MTTSTESKYLLALKDLKDINDKLFYDELKEKMNIYMYDLTNEYSKVEEAMQNVMFQVDAFSTQFNMLAEDATMKLNTAVSNVMDEVPTQFQQQLDVLAKVYFKTEDVSKEIKQFIYDQSAAWKLLSEEILKQQKETDNQLVSSIHDCVEKLQSTNETYLENLKADQIKLQYRLETLSTSLTEKVNNKFTKVEEGFKDVSALIQETSQSYTLQLRDEKEKQHTNWEAQNQEIELVKLQQIKHQENSKKWFGAIVILQSVAMLVIVGLYFWG